MDVDLVKDSQVDQYGKESFCKGKKSEPEILAMRYRDWKKNTKSQRFFSIKRRYKRHVNHYQTQVSPDGS